MGYDRHALYVSANVPQHSSGTYQHLRAVVVGIAEDGSARNLPTDDPYAHDP